MRIVVLGGTGFVGRRLVETLLSKGHQVQVLTRDPDPARQLWSKDLAQLSITVYKPLEPQTWAHHLEGWEGIVNVVGEPLTGSRWTDEQKAEIRRSRIQGTQSLATAIASLQQKPRIWVNGSAIGYYGPHNDEILDETSSPGSDFLAQLCQEWETATQPVTPLGVRVVLVRTGLVLGSGGGVLAQMVPLFQNFGGGPLGSGQQWLSWIHRDDWVGLVLYALTQESVQGIVNGTAPEPVTMSTFCQTLGRVIGRPSWLPVPAMVLELVLGEAAQVVLTGQRVIPQRIRELGFQFQYPSLQPALQQILLSLGK